MKAHKTADCAQWHIMLNGAKTVCENEKPLNKCFLLNEAMKSLEYVEYKTTPYESTKAKTA